MVSKNEKGEPDWGATWDKLQAGTAGVMWKDGEQNKNFEIQFNFLAEKAGLKQDAGRILVPLAGDSAFVQHAYSKGMAVTSMEYVPTAVDAMKAQFNDKFAERTVDDKTACSELDGGRLRIYKNDFFVCVPAEEAQSSFVFDKDSFGAIEPNMRSPYLKMLQRYLKPGAHVLLEGKYRKEDVDAGPPYHLSRQLIDETWGVEGFQVLEHIESFYPLGRPNFLQQAFLLKFNGSP